MNNSNELQRRTAVLVFCRIASVVFAFLCCTSPLIVMAQEQDQPVAKNKAEAGKRPENLPSGINDSFLDPDMNVEDFIARFEIESREVFACREQILAAIQLEKGMDVADIGSGTGLYLKALSTSVGEKGKVYAVDISPNFIKHLRQRTKDENLENVDVVLCSERDANLKPDSIDRAFICDVYHHFEYPNASMKSILRAMRKGGKLVVVDFDRIPGKSRDWLLGHIRAPKEVFRQEIIDAGFTFDGEIKVEGFEENYLLRFTKK
ncbi:MAG: class I SAM-dependent methyltransferase [Aureliella sp.]